MFTGLRKLPSHFSPYLKISPEFPSGFSFYIQPKFPCGFPPPPTTIPKDSPPNPGDFARWVSWMLDTSLIRSMSSIYSKKNGWHWNMHLSVRMAISLWLSVVNPSNVRKTYLSPKNHLSLTDDGDFSSVNCSFYQHLSFITMYVHHACKICYRPEIIIGDGKKTLFSSYVKCCSLHLSER